MSIESMHSMGNINEVMEHQAGTPINVEQLDLPAVQVDVRHGEAPALTEEMIEAAAEHVDAHDIHKARAKRIGQIAEMGDVISLSHDDAEAIQEVATRDAAVDTATERRRLN